MIKVSEGIFRGPRPTDIKDVYSKGIKTIINLQRGWHELFFEDEYEYQSKGDLNVHKLFLSDFRPPKLEQTVQFLTIMSNCEKPVYIHCRHGVDRTGYMVAAYRVIEEHMDIEKAIDEWKEHGFHKYAYFNWPSHFRKNIKKLL